jgi:hypothetical protein
MPVAVVDDVTSISGMNPWWTVKMAPTVPLTRSAISEAPSTIPLPPAAPSNISRTCP